MRLILTGEYPPQPGGVSDYTRQVAVALAALGEPVAVYAPPCDAGSPDGPGVVVRRLPDHFGPRSLLVLDRELGRLHGCRVLVQYVPHAFGYKALNLPFCLWLYARRRRFDLAVMFHEVAFPLRRGQPLRHQFLGAVNLVMASLLARAARRLYVSTPAWAPLLRKLAPPRPRITWLPIPSNLPVAAAPGRIPDFRAAFGPDTQAVGHFGTFGPHLTVMLCGLLPALLAQRPQRHVVLFGRGNEAFTKRLQAVRPDLVGRLHAAGDLPPDDLAAHIAACDLLVQPYPDGATGRRTSLTAGLALGRAVVTTDGPLTEPLWRTSGAVALVGVGRPVEETVARVDALLADAGERLALGRRAAALYHERFALEHTIAALRAE